jgi:hypothetical protein
MHEYIDIQFKRSGKAFDIERQVAHGFEFKETDPPTRTINIGFRAYDDGTRYRLAHIRQVKGWRPEEFRVRTSVEDGSLVLRGDDEYSLPEGFYEITVNVSGAKVKKRPPRVEVKHDGHGVVAVDLETDDRTIEVDLTGADPQVLDVLDASTLGGEPAVTWLDDDEIRPTRRACLLNLLASLRVFPKLSEPLIADVTCIFTALDDRTYAQVTPAFFDRVEELSEQHDRVYPEGRPHASIHNLLIPALCEFDAGATGVFEEQGLLSFRVEGSPSLQMVIATPKTVYDCRYADLDLDLANPLQDLAGLMIHMGEVLDGKPTNHLDLRRKLANGKAKPYLFYTVKAAP